MMNIKPSALHNVRLRRQSGFTLIELTVVLVIIGIMAVSFAYSLMGTTNDAKANLAKISLASDFPQAIFSYLSVVGGVPANTDVTNALAARGIKKTTPWHETWSATYSSKSTPSIGDDVITVTYPIGSQDGANLASYIATALDDDSKYPQIQSAASNSSELTVTYFVM